MKNIIDFINFLYSNYLENKDLKERRKSWNGQERRVRR